MFVVMQLKVQLIGNGQLLLQGNGQLLLQMAKYFEKCMFGYVSRHFFDSYILNSVICTYVAVYLCRIY